MQNFDWTFWITVVVGAAIRAFSDDVVHPFRGFITFSTGVLIAYAGTNPVLDWMGWDPEIYRIGVAAVLALFSANLVKILLIATDDLKSVKQLITFWRTGK